MEKHTFLIIAVIAVIFASCNRGGQKNTEYTEQNEIVIDIERIIDKYEHCDSGIEETDSYVNDVEMFMAYFKQKHNKLASNVEHYMDSLEQIMGIPVRYEEDVVVVRSALRELRRYQTKERLYYPEKEIKMALDDMGFELGYDWSHGTEMSFLCGLFYWYNFATQAALLSPNIEFVTHLHSPDYQIGLLSYHEWSYWPMMSFIIKQEDNYCTIQLIDLEVNLKKVFQIIDERGREYYLLVSQYDNPDVRSDMDVYLYEKTRDKKDVTLVTQFHDDSFLWNMWNMLNYHEITDDFKITFNPQKKEWDICKKKGEYWHKIEGTKSLYLHLDVEPPYFEME